MKVGQKFLIIIFLLTVVMVGCKSNHLKSEGVVGEEQILRAEQTPASEPLVIDRGWSERVLYFHNMATEHEALYLAGPFEKVGSEDGYFRSWDGDSAVSMVVSPVVFVGKTLGLPISLVLTPPWERQFNQSGFEVVEPTFYMPGEASGMMRREERE